MNINIIENRIKEFEELLKTKPEYKTQASSIEVQRRIDKWKKLLSEITELNYESYIAAIEIDMNQLDADVYSINCRENSLSQFSDVYKEANALLRGNSGGNADINTIQSNVNKTRDILRKAGLL